MKRLLILTSIFLALIATAQQSPTQSPLLDHLAGKWLMEGMVGKQQVTHELDAEWVLQHHYLRFHEVSQDKNDKGEPQYDATVFIGWNEKTKQYACVWLDVYGGLTSESIGVATPKGMSLILCSQMSGAKRASRIVLSTIRKRKRGRTGSTIF